MYFQKYIGGHTVSVISMKLMYMLVIVLSISIVVGALGAACYFDYGCIYFVVM